MSVRRLLAVVIVGFTLGSSCEEPAPPFVPVVTSIEVSPATRSFTSLTLAVQFSAVVRDQNGTQMGGQSVTWGTTNGTVATVSLAGLVTSQAVGTANITATIGAISGQGVVTVTQVPREIQRHDGNAQSAVVGSPVGVPIVARVVDSSFRPIPGITVGFAVTAGGGSVGTPSDVSDAAGQSSTSWTLGTTSGTQSVTASATALPSVVFTAQALAAAPDTVIKASTDGQTVPAGTAVSPAPAVQVRDQHGNPTPGVTVTYAITQGGGQLTGPTPTTSGSGTATVGSWVVGASGTQEVTATVTGLSGGGNPITFTVSVQPPGIPASVAVSGGNNQTGLSGYALNVPPAAIVRDASNNPVQGVTVDFAVTAGGGSLTGATAVTDLQGIAQVGSWTINAGANTMTATVTGLTPATFNATGVASAFNITISYVGTLPNAAQSAAFDSAAARWSRVIIGDLSNLNGFNVPAGACGRPEIPQQTVNIDDVLIFAILDSIDGPGAILGSAGPCSIRLSNQLTIYGLMRFDTADVATMQANGTLRDVILHEMAHVLGLGTLWETKGLLVGKDLPDVYFTGAEARAQFDAIGGTGFTGGGKVPVENCVGIPGCGGGTRNGHWRESVFNNELMTGYIDGPNPLSVVTSAQFLDLGYQVNLDESDAFSVSFPLLRARRAGAPVYLKDDILRIPIDVLDAAGRVIRVIPPR